MEIKKVPSERSSVPTLPGELWQYLEQRDEVLLLQAVTARLCQKGSEPGGIIVAVPQDSAREGRSYSQPFAPPSLPEAPGGSQRALQHNTPALGITQKLTSDYQHFLQGLSAAPGHPVRIFSRLTLPW